MHHRHFRVFLQRDSLPGSVRQVFLNQSFGHSIQGVEELYHNKIRLYMKFVRLDMKFVKLLLLAIIASSVVSCGYAKKDDLDALRDEVMATRQLSQQALDMAKEARASAERAEDSASRTQEIVNRSYKAGMRK
jgi:hypothetical protein